jgi:hypothetical protein
LNGFDSALDLRRALLHVGRPLLPDKQHAIPHQPHVPKSRLQQREFVNEQALQFGFGHVHGTTLPLAVVVRVVAVATLRPAPRQRPSARFAPDKAAEREIRMVAVTRRAYLNATVRDGLRPIKRLVADEGIEIGARRHAALPTPNQADVHDAAQHLPEALRRQD